MQKIKLPRVYWDNSNNIQNHDFLILESSEPIRIDPLHEIDPRLFVSQYQRFGFDDKVIKNSLLSEELQKTMFAATARNKDLLKPINEDHYERAIADGECDKKESRPSIEINYLAKDEVFHSDNTEIEKLITLLCNRNFIDCDNGIDVIGTKKFLDDFFSNAIEEEVGFISSKLFGSGLTQILLANGLEIQKKLSLSLGQDLTTEQMQELPYPIALPVWKQECLKSNVPCLSFELYIDSYTIDGARKGGGAYFGGKSMRNVIAGKNIHTESIQVGEYFYGFDKADWLHNAGVHIEDLFHVKGGKYDLENAFIRALPTYEGKIVFEVKEFICENSVIAAKEIYLPSIDHVLVNGCTIIGNIHYDGYPDEL